MATQVNVHHIITEWYLNPPALSVPSYCCSTPAHSTYISAKLGYRQFLGAIGKLRKATICFVMSVCLSVRPSTRNNSAPTGRLFMKIHILVFVETLRWKIPALLISDKNSGYFTSRPICIYDHISLKYSYNENFSDKSCIQNQDTYFVFSNSCFLFENHAVETYSTAGDSTDENMAHAHFTLGT
jgi:hypothetical protein